MSELGPNLSRVVFVGYRASGKTTLARALSQHVGSSWCDLDQNVENLAGMTISSIFEQHGQQHFS